MLSESTRAVATSFAVAGVVSMLHEDACANSAMRMLNDIPVLRHTLNRLAQSRGLSVGVVLCWEDQADAARRAIDGTSVALHIAGGRAGHPQLAAIAAAIRWSDGWRGGLLGSCFIDAGFDAQIISGALAQTDHDAVLLVPASSALIDPDIIDRLIAHARPLDHRNLIFAPAPRGITAMIVRTPGLAELARTRSHPGRHLHYWPGRHGVDPVGSDACLQLDPTIARAAVSLDLSSESQIERVGSFVRQDLPTAELIRAMQSGERSTPRDLTVELTTRRATKPIFSPAHQVSLNRGDADVDALSSIIQEAASIDDLRLTLTGVGDPLLHPKLFAFVECARRAGIRAIHVETDLLPDEPDAIDRLARSGIDVVSIHLPAVSTQTYQRVMGVDRFVEVVGNLKRFVEARAAAATLLPIVVPTFVKCEANLHELEPWYDQWLAAVGSAAIVGPSDFAGRFQYPGVCDMAPPRRVPCRRIASRLAVLSDGCSASCENDLQSTRTCDSVRKSWNDLASLRALHAQGRWDEIDLCRRCRDWDRP